MSKVSTNKIKTGFIFILVIAALIPLKICYTQSERWVYTYNGLGNSNDQCYSIIYGNDGNIYAAGYAYNGDSNKDFLVISLTPDGTERWVYTYNGPADSADVAYSLVYGLDGNIYVAGYGYQNSSNKDILVISLTPDGEERWTYFYNGLGNGDDEAKEIIYGSDNNVYCAGGSYGAGTSGDMMLVGLDTLGSETLFARWDLDEGPDYARAFIRASDNNFYFTGTTSNHLFGWGWAVVSLNFGGGNRWQYAMCLSYYYDAGNDIVESPNGKIYMAGNIYDRFNVSCFDTSGHLEWVYDRFGSANALTYGPDSNIYATGNNTTDLFVVCLSPSGDSIWMYSYNGSGNVFDEGKAIVCGFDDNIYVAGRTKNINTNYDFTVISIDTAGSANWVYLYNGPGSGDDVANSIVYGSDGYIYASGWSYDSVTAQNFTVISLAPNNIAVKEKRSISTGRSNYLIPTYFKNKITIRSIQKSSGMIKICISNTLGNIVYESSVSSMPTRFEINNSTISQLPSGIYYISIHEDNVLCYHQKTIKIK